MKKLNTVRTRLPIYDEKELYADKTLKPQNTELPTVKQGTNQVSAVYQHTESSKSMAAKNVHQDNIGELEVLAEAISGNRLPIPELTIFSGDPLIFNHWKSSIQTLIKRKNIPTSETIFFLQKYVGVAAKEALDGYFLNNSQDSYSAAWALIINDMVSHL